jgi:uncharacterized protein YecT (DUF1311 family)
MTTELRDMIETEKSSNCCGSSMYELGDNYICTDCKEHCEAVSDEPEDRAFSNEQLAFIAAQEKKCHDAGCEDTHKCE